MRSGTILLSLLSMLPVASAVGSEVVEPRVRLELSPTEATVGDRLAATLTVVLPEDQRLKTAEIGPRLGSFTVVGGDWSGPLPTESGQRWVWTGSLAAFRVGETEVPAIRVEFLLADGTPAFAESPARGVVVNSVLSPEDFTEVGKSPEPAGLKPPASLEPDYSGLWTALVLLLLLLILGAVVGWLRRRFAAKPARIELPDDPFRRVPPHVWVYEALQALLDRGLVEQGQLDPFFMELARIVKVYLGGRYRVDLLERTSGEVPGVLEQVLTPAPTIQTTRKLLGVADRVKFAGERPDPDRCRRAVESAYAIVDATRPREEVEPADERGAA